MKYHDNQARTNKKTAPRLEKERSISSAIVFISNVTMSKRYYIIYTLISEK
jgi:hypothetical protein